MLTPYRLPPEPSHVPDEPDTAANLALLCFVAILCLLIALFAPRDQSAREPALTGHGVYHSSAFARGPGRR